MACDNEKCLSCPAEEGCDAAKNAILATVLMRQLRDPTEDIEVSKEKAMNSFFKFMDLSKKAREEGRRLSMDEFDPLAE